MSIDANTDVCKNTILTDVNIVNDEPTTSDDDDDDISQIDIFYHDETMDTIMNEFTYYIQEHNLQFLTGCNYKIRQSLQSKIFGDS